MTTIILTILGVALAAIAVPPKRPLAVTVRNCARWVRTRWNRRSLLVRRALVAPPQTYSAP